MSQDASARQDMHAHAAALSQSSAALAPSSPCLDSLHATAARQVIIKESTCHLKPIWREQRSNPDTSRNMTLRRAQDFTAWRVRQRRLHARQAASVRHAAGRPWLTAPPAPLAFSATAALSLSQLDPAAQVWHSENQRVRGEK